MKMRTRGASGVSRIPDEVSGIDRLPRFDQRPVLLQMYVISESPVRMVNEDVISFVVKIWSGATDVRVRLYVNDHSAACGVNPGSLGHRKIHRVLVLTEMRKFSVERLAHE